MEPTLRVEARFKNARLYNAIAKAALPPDPGREQKYQTIQRNGPVLRFCQAHNLQVQSVYGLLNLRTKPVWTTHHGAVSVSRTARRLASILEQPLDWLFPEELYAVTWPRTLAIETAPKRIAIERMAREMVLPPSQFEAMSQKELSEALKGSLLSLTPREQMVITKRFGLDDGEETSLSECADRMGVSMERVRQIENKALRKLRHPSRNRALRGFLDGGTIDVD